VQLVRLAALFCVLASPLYALPAVVQTNSDTGAGATRVKAFTSNNTATNMIFAGMGGYNLSASTATPSCSDTRGNTYTVILTIVGSGGNLNAAGLYAKNIGTGANTVTCVLSGQTHTDMIIAEYSGLSTTSPLDTFATSNTGPCFGCGSDFTGGTTLTYPQPGGGTFATCSSNELIASFTYAQHAATTFTITTPASGYTVEQNTTNPDGESAGLADSTTVAASPGTYTLAWTSSIAETNWGGFMVGFKSANCSSIKHKSQIL
jgi:hypothetical protein